MIVFDLDGTLADIEHRAHLIHREKKDWDSFFDKCHLDSPIWSGIGVYRALMREDYHVQIWTGRSDVVENKTLDWIIRHVQNDFKKRNLKMRPSGFHIPDHILKQQWLTELRAKGGNVDLAFEDRSRVVQMWRNHGVSCYQVADGNF